MSKKKICMFLVGVLTFSLVVAISTTVFAAEKYVMRIGHGLTTEHVRDKAFIRFKEAVEKQTNGMVKIKIFPNAQLGTDRELMESTKLGTIEGCRGGAFEEYSPELLVLTLPFMFKSRSQVDKLYEGEVGDYLAEVGRENGVIIIAWAASGGFRQFTNNKRPINTPEDMRGLKVRVPPIETIKLSISAFGASPTPVAFAELYMSLKTGLCDGQENPFEHIYDKKLYEVQKYLSVVNYMYHPDPLFVSVKWWDKLPKDYQEIVKISAQEASKWQDQQSYTADLEKLYKLGERGMIINWISDENLALFREKAQSVYQYYIDKGTFSKDLLQKVIAAGKQ